MLPLLLKEIKNEMLIIKKSLMIPCYDPNGEDFHCSFYTLLKVRTMHWWHKVWEKRLAFAYACLLSTMCRNWLTLVIYTYISVSYNLSSSVYRVWFKPSFFPHSLRSDRYRYEVILWRCSTKAKWNRRVFSHVLCPEIFVWWCYRWNLFYNKK